MRFTLSKRKSPRFIRLLIFLVILTLIYLGVTNNMNPVPSKPKAGIKFQNHVQNSARLFQRGLMINTTNCQIPDIDPWDEEIKPLYQSNFQWGRNCSEKYDDIWSKYSTFVNNVLTLPERSDDYPPSCCYEIITRHKDASIADMDEVFTTSNCIPIKPKSLNISTEFLVVKCKTGSYLFGTEYTFYHGVATPANNQRRESIEKKCQFWKKKNQPQELEDLDSNLPPNVLIIGLDSATRLNFRRQMPKMTVFLQRLGAVEMLGYSKVSDGTFPNILPSLAGYSITDYETIYQENQSIVRNSSIFIWSRFDEAHYLTAEIEDSPGVAIFTSVKNGFFSQPVDFYPRPLFQAAATPETSCCAGPLRSDELQIAYFESVMDFATKAKAPIFNLLWNTYNSHNHLNGLQRGDERMTGMLKRLQVKGQLKNSILVVMGDHGMRYGAITETLIGRSYENNLPVFWIHLSEEVKKRFPSWEESLQINSRRLTSPFLFYWTMNKMLDTFTRTPTPTDAIPSLSRKHRYNFFDPVPENVTCSDVGVPDPACSCHFREEITPEDPLLGLAAKAVLVKVNAELMQKSGESTCANLTLAKVTSGSVLDKNVNVNLFQSNSTTSSNHQEGINVKILQVSVNFETPPEKGAFQIQSMVNYSPMNKRVLEVIHVHRSSKINPDHVKCVRASDKSVKKWLDLFCYCVS